MIFSLSVIIAAINSRVIRGSTLAGGPQHAYVEAARAIGCGHTRVILRHLLPDVAATIVVLATIGLGAAILAESALSFLGFGVPPPYPSQARSSRAPNAPTCPAPRRWPPGHGVAISLAGFGFNMLGDPPGRPRPLA